MNNSNQSLNQSSDNSSDNSSDKSSDEPSSDSSNPSEENISQINRDNFKDFIYSNKELTTNSSKELNIDKTVNPIPNKKKIRTRRNRNIYRDADGAPQMERSNHMSGMVEVIDSVGSNSLYIPENVLPTQAKYVVHAWQKKRKGTVDDEEAINRKDEEEYDDEELSDSDLDYMAPITVDKMSDRLPEMEEPENKGVCMICDLLMYENQDLKNVEEFGLVHLKCFYLSR